jgi:Zn-dependent M28 family amino/carboxypeptidase
VKELQFRPQAVVIVDMIGDADLNIYMEKNSNSTLRTEIWDTAAGLGYQENFIPEEKYSMLDDHTPFLEAGIPAVDLIDFDYPFWHTTQDTPDKVSAHSLKVVGETLWTWVTAKDLQDK